MKPNIVSKKQLSKGKFIVFEGGEACGKTTQIELLKEILPKSQTIFTKEPGGTKEAEQIRKLVITGSKDKLLAESELLLIYAARFEHVQKVILPALAQGKNVISDRFNLSTKVYQGAARGLAIELIEALDSMILQNFAPDLTFIFDLPVKEIRKRVAKRAGTNERFEKFSDEFHEKIRQGFLTYAKGRKDHVILDASKTAKQLHKLINAHLSMD